ncbi:MAG: hypothetical protein NPIRA01_13110 [Nitrospirales bacterium]|nr:MAG: hypothetical protein NPIRA01_13110 [Nitrospirales bacterium]
MRWEVERNTDFGHGNTQSHATMDEYGVVMMYKKNYHKHRQDSGKKTKPRFMNSQNLLFIEEAGTR